MPSPFLSANAVESGQISSLALTQHCLERIAALNPQLNAFCAISSTALDDARASDRRRASGATLGPLDGVPVAIKDNLLVAGMPASWGSAAYAEFIPEADELPVARLRSAGAVIIGKTNTPELAARGYTGNPTFGVTRNPWNRALTPGGSSGGSAAAVASGMVPLAIGTDGGGSIRRPAAHTGIVGLKPGIGRIARSGGFLPINLDFEVIGLMGRTVADVDMLARVMSGGDRSDPTSRFLPDVQAGLHKASLRIGYVDRIGDSPVDGAIRRSIAEAADHLRAMGHDIVPMAFPWSIEEFSSVWGSVLNSGVAGLRRQSPERFERTQPEYHRQADEGDSMSAGELFLILEQVARLRGMVGALFGGIDVLMTPCTAAQPWPVEAPYPDSIDGHPAGPRAHAIFTGWVNVSGHPAISVPVAPDSSGLPIGMQLVGDLGSEGLLLALSESYESAHGWRERRPALD